MGMASELGWWGGQVQFGFNHHHLTAELEHLVDKNAARWWQVVIVAG